MKKGRNKELDKVFRTNAVCPKCGKHLYTTDVYGYSFTCKECDENFYSFEVKEVDSEILEISIPMTVETYEKNLEKLGDIADVYDCDFLGFDDTCDIMDIGWDVYKETELPSYFPDSVVLYEVAKQLGRLFDVQENSRPKTEEEIREEFLEHIRGLVEYWEQENRTPSVRGKLEGLAFSILSTIDGQSADLPGYELSALPSSDEDIQFFRERNENYYGEVPFDIAGCLHEHFYKKQEEVKVETIGNETKVHTAEVNCNPWKQYCSRMIATYVDKKYGAACGSDAEKIMKDIMNITGMSKEEAKEMEEQADYIIWLED